MWLALPQQIYVLDDWLVGSCLGRTICLRSNRRVVLIVIIKYFRASMIKITAGMRVLRHYKSCVRPVVLPNAEEGFVLFSCPYVTLRECGRMARRGAVLAPLSPPSRQLIISKGGGVKSTNSAVHPSESIFVCDKLSVRLISKAVSPASASSSQPTPRHEIFPATESFKTSTKLDADASLLIACSLAFVSLIG